MSLGARYRRCLSKSMGHLNARGSRCRALQPAESLGTKDTIRALIPMPGSSLDEAIAAKTVTIGDKQVNLLEKVLNVMNMAPTRTNMKWLQEEGFKKFPSIQVDSK